MDLKQEIIDNCIKFKEEFRPIESGGRRSEFLFDFKSFLLRKDVLTEISRIFWEKYKNECPFQVGALEIAGISILTAIVLYAPDNINVNSFIVRKERKTLGMGNIIEGVVNELPVILIDDVFNSGKSLNRARVVIGRDTVKSFVILNFMNNHVAEIDVSSIFVLSDFNDCIDTNRRETMDTSVSDMKHVFVPKSSFVPVWSRMIPGGGIFHVVPKSTPLLVDNVIYRGSDSGIFSAFDSSTAVNIWNHHASGGVKRKGILSSPAYHDGVVYYGAYNGLLYALDALTGKEKWAHHYCDWIGSSPCLIPEKNIILIGFEFAGKTAPGSLTAATMDTGELLWSVETQKMQHGSATYDQLTNLAVWGTNDNRVVATDVDTGRVVWEFIGGEAVKAQVSIKNDIVAFAGNDKFIYALNLRTGTLLGKWETSGICFTTPLITGDRIWCGSTDGSMYVIDLNLKKVHRRLDFHRKIYSSPVLTRDGVMFGTNDGNVYVIDEHSLALVDNFCVKDGVTNKIVVSPDETRFYVSTVMNDLFCFKKL